MPATDLPKQYPFTDRPEYNDYIVAREMDIVAFPFAPDPDWRTTPTDVLLLDGNGRPVQRFQVPLISGRASAAWALAAESTEARDEGWASVPSIQDARHNTIA